MPENSGEAGFRFRRLGDVLRVSAINRFHLAAGTLLVIAGAIASVLIPLVVVSVLRAVTFSEDLTRELVKLAATIIASVLMGAVGAQVVAASGERAIQNIRQLLAERIVGARPASVQRLQPGDLLSRATGDVLGIRSVLTATFMMSPAALVSVVGSVIVMVALDLTLFLWMVSAVSVPMLVGPFLAPMIRKSVKTERTAVGDLSSRLERLLGAFNLMKLSRAEHDEIADVVTNVEEARRSSVRLALLRLLANSASQLAVHVSFFTILAVGTYRVERGSLDAVELVAFLLYSVQMTAPLALLASAFALFHTGMGSLERVAEVLSLEQELRDLPRRDELKDGLIELSVEDLSFCHADGQTTAIQHLYIQFPSSGLVAITGLSGSGKTSLLRLIVGLLEPTGGTISLNGIPTSQIDLGTIRQIVGFVEQETPIIEGTIRENLGYGTGYVDDTSVAEVLRVVGLSTRFPDSASFDAPIGSRGGTLSGGERQRLAVARAILRRPRVLLLDEPASQLDEGAELELVGVLRRIADDICVVLVTHHAQNAAAADLVVPLTPLAEGSPPGDAATAVGGLDSIVPEPH
ncbi:MAG: ABC transporter ATP-binding protein [Acidimicrobiaceae bacterium]|nr:ABC transporter ATP-binding protein [Acidimicrobiaceae bacterium]